MCFLCLTDEHQKSTSMRKILPWDLIILKLRGQVSKEEEANFKSWLEQDDNRHLFLQLELVWKNIQNKTSSYEPDVEYYWKELSARMDQEKHVDVEMPTSSGKSKYIPLKHIYRVVAAASILLILTLSGAYYLGTRDSNQQTISQTYSSLTGKSKVILPDGTEVWLHSNTALTYNSSFKSDKREVSMRGEAYFNVTHDSQRPFIVNVDGVSVEVHGTKFNVNSCPSTENVLVSLYEGSVSMKVADKNIFLKPGQEGTYDKHNHSLDVKEGDVEFAKSWTNDQLRFENKNIREVCRYLSKWYSVDIYVDPAIPDNQSYTFTLRNENLEEVVRMMSCINSIDYQFNRNNELILKPKY